jgi:hypothetical protein
MKTLDDAVIELDGVWPSKSDLCVYMVEYVSPKVWSAGSQVANWLFTKEQFTQRAKELGFVGKYRWGVEYPTDGKRLDLDDDIIVEMKCKSGEWHPAGADEFYLFDPSYFSALKIVDRRYKPADTSYLDKPTYTPTKSADDCLVEHAIKTGQKRYDNELSDMILEEVAKHGSISATLMSDSNTFEFPAQDDSDWWDWQNDKPIKLPPVGTSVLVNFPHNRNLNATVVAHYGGKAVYVVAEESAYMDEKESFRPADHATRKAEAEKKKVVDAAIEAMKPNPLTGTMEKWFGKLYDLGYLRLPTEKN